jgi:hypothetical protein
MHLIETIEEAVMLWESSQVESGAAKQLMSQGQAMPTLVLEVFLERRGLSVCCMSRDCHRHQGRH